MEVLTVIAILSILVAIVGGLNTILEFAERLHSYSKALKERRTSSLPTSYVDNQPALMQREAELSNAPFKPDSYTPYKWMSAVKEIAEEITPQPLADANPFLKKTHIS